MQYTLDQVVVLAEAIRVDDEAVTLVETERTYAGNQAGVAGQPEDACLVAEAGRGWRLAEA